MSRPAPSSPCVRPELSTAYRCVGHGRCVRSRRFRIKVSLPNIVTGFIFWRRANLGVDTAQCAQREGDMFFFSLETPIDPNTHARVQNCPVPPARRDFPMGGNCINRSCVAGQLPPRDRQPRDSCPPYHFLLQRSRDSSVFFQSFITQISRGARKGLAACHLLTIGAPQSDPLSRLSRRDLRDNLESDMDSCLVGGLGLPLKP